MTNIYCLDSSVLVKALVPEEGSEEASALLRRIISTGGLLVAPAFAWAEVGTVLRKKVRSGFLNQSEADAVWACFTELSIEYIQDSKVPQAAWSIAGRLGLPTLYDAAFLAVCETLESGGSRVEFWTADRELAEIVGLANGERVVVHLLEELR